MPAGTATKPATKQTGKQVAKKRVVRQKPAAAATTPQAQPQVQTQAQTQAKKQRRDWQGLFEKAPLALTVLYQSYIVTLWSYYTLHETTITKINQPFLDFTHALFSMFAGLSLDFVMIGTALRNDQKGPVHFLTLVGAWIASSAIAFSYFEGTLFQKSLHVTWSTMVFLFSWSLAEGRGTDITKSLREMVRKKN